MLAQNKPVGLANFQLVLFYQRVLKLHDFIALCANHVIVMALAVQFFKSPLPL